jgi:hypothetical protein
LRSGRKYYYSKKEGGFLFLASADYSRTFGVFVKTILPITDLTNLFADACHWNTEERREYKWKISAY